VPLVLVIYVLRNNLEKQFKTLIRLKLLFPNGNFKIDIDRQEYIKKHLGFKDLRTLKSQFKSLLKLNWMWKDKRTNNYNLRSFVAVSDFKEDEYYGGYEVNKNDLKCFKAWLGCVIFDYCVIRFWQKFIKSDLRKIKINEAEYFKISQKGKGCVREKGSNNKTLSFRILLREPAKIALNGVSKFLGISKSKVNRLKQEAILNKYIEVKHIQYVTNFPITTPKNKLDFFQETFIEDCDLDKDSCEIAPTGENKSSDFYKIGQRKGFLIKSKGKIIKNDIDIIQPLKAVRKRFKNYK
jgi:hypothetical protein